jgi:hypothetical protein
MSLMSRIKRFFKKLFGGKGSSGQVADDNYPMF